MVIGLKKEKSVFYCLYIWVVCNYVLGVVCLAYTILLFMNLAFL